MRTGMEYSRDSTRPEMIRLLLFSHDPELQLLLEPTIGQEFSLFLERRMDRIRQIISRGQCEVVIVDLDSGYPVEAQLDRFGEIRDLGVPVVLMADDETRAIARELARGEVCDYIRKPPVLPELREVVRRAYGRALPLSKPESIPGAGRLTASGCGRLIGSGPGSRAIYDLIGRVAGLEVPVLITGESGTGKELIARCIHDQGIRRERPFVAVSCGAIPETLVEAALFGAEKGAYTGANARRKGLFEEAGNGTLFLDEIGELSLQTQVKLLRVLQQREFSRLGSSHLIPLHARLLFATHRNLSEMVEEGTFRGDLYYRVNVMGIRSPSLRDRAEDIPELARHFLEEYFRLYQKPVKRVTSAAMTLLVEYDWPGNVRELENAIQRAIIMSDHDAIQPDDFPETMRSVDFGGAVNSLPGTSFEEQLQDYKLKLAHRAIHECQGNKTLAARSLQISRTYLHRLIRDPGLEEGASVLGSAPN